MAVAVVACSGCFVPIDAALTKGGVGLCDKCQSKALQAPRPTDSKYRIQKPAAKAAAGQPLFAWERRVAGWLSVVWIGMALCALLAMYMCFWSIMMSNGGGLIAIVGFAWVAAFAVTSASVGWLLSNLLRVAIDLANRPDRQA